MGLLHSSRLPPSLWVLVSRAGVLLLLPFVFMLSTSATQPRFISIDCGSTQSYQDSIGISWTTDEAYISTGSNKNVTIGSDLVNSWALSTVRYFYERRNKHCYRLPVTQNTSYLIRPAFLYSDLADVIPTGYSFNLSIDSTIVHTLRITPSDVNLTHWEEYFAVSTSDHVDFCLIPLVGVPFISSLELREITPEMSISIYVFHGYHSKLLQRQNFGVGTDYPVIRFPDDKYDRRWIPSGQVSALTNWTSQGIPVADNKPPGIVYQSAAVASTVGDSFDIMWTTATNPATNRFYCSLYFAEILGPTEVRNRFVDITLNGDGWVYDVDVPSYGSEVYKDPNEIQPIAASLNITFNIRSNASSVLPALINAGELHALYETVTTTTRPSDVVGLQNVSQSFGLLSWTGDPCLPVSWDWISCNFVDGGLAVTQLNLSGYQINKPIPEVLATLSSLTDVRLDNCSLVGTIPSLAGLTRLRTLNLQHNQLTGPIPETLSLFPSLTELHLQNNQLTGPVLETLSNVRNLTELHLQNNQLTGLIPETFANVPNLTELFLEGNDLTGPVPNSIVSKPGLNLTVDSYLLNFKTKKSNTAPVIAGIVGGAVVMILTIAIITVIYRRHKRNGASIYSNPAAEFAARASVSTVKGKGSGSTHHQGLSGEDGSQHTRQARSFTYAQIRDATENFSKKIGEGGFGPVYHGKLKTREVAVKVKSKTTHEGLSEFSNEVSVLSRVHHVNLVSLVGFCNEGGEEILVYEYMPKGTLREHLYGSGLTIVVDWRTRLNMALNAARGLEYLHYDCNPQITHQDVKSSNILLDENFVAKVADFGISRESCNDGLTTGIYTDGDIAGTRGYIDPELFCTKRISRRGDVYAFGVVLLEIISGRPPLDPITPDNNLVIQAGEVLRDGNLNYIVDPKLDKRYDIEAMWTLFELATSCIKPTASERPDMRQVVRELTGLGNSEYEEENSKTAAAYPFRRQVRFSQPRQNSYLASSSQDPLISRSDEETVPESNHLDRHTYDEKPADSNSLLWSEQQQPRLR